MAGNPLFKDKAYQEQLRARRRAKKFNQPKADSTAEELFQRIDQKIAEHWDDLLDVLIKKAIDQGDAKVAQYLVDRRVGPVMDRSGEKLDAFGEFVKTLMTMQKTDTDKAVSSESSARGVKCEVPDSGMGSEW
jgi:hypothetical protein